MAIAEDLTGQQFGFLTVIERDYEAQKEHDERQAWWKCHCSACGQDKSLRASIIKKSKTCGCHRKTPLKKMVTPQKIGKLDLTGQKFNRLLVLEEADEEHQVYYNGKHKVTWKCQCDCGNICYATTENLRRGGTQSCGCLNRDNRKKNFDDLSGQRFGHLLVLHPVTSEGHNTKYLVRCDCGKEYEMYRSNLTQGVQSCGCGIQRYSKGEEKIKNLLDQNHINYIFQKSFTDFKYQSTNGTPRYDFFLPDYNILIEYDGFQHFEPTFAWDTDETFLLRQQHDQEKNEYARSHNYTLIRIPYTYLNNIDIQDLLQDSQFKIY